MEITVIRQCLLDDLVPVKAFAEAIGKSERTLRRLNLPTKSIGRTRYVIVSKAKQQLFGDNHKRGRGRPRAK